MKIYNEWSKKDWLNRHVVEELKPLAEQLTAKQLEQLDGAMSKYYSRIVAHIRRDYNIDRKGDNRDEQKLPTTK